MRLDGMFSFLYQCIHELAAVSPLIGKSQSIWPFWAYRLSGIIPDGQHYSTIACHVKDFWICIM